jgi:hypothetical protein
MSEVVDALNALKERLISERVLFFAVNDTKAKIAERAFDRGKLTDGGDIRYNEDYEVYAYTPPSPRAVSKKGKPYSEWKRPIPKNAKGNAASIKGGYYATYLKYKDAMGRPPLELTGRLRKDFLSSLSIQENSPTSVSIVLRGDNAAKYNGLAESKGEFLQPNSEEVKFFAQRLSAL